MSWTYLHKTRAFAASALISLVISGCGAGLFFDGPIAESVITVRALPPTAGAFGSTVLVTPTSFTLQWTAATDASTPSSEMEYLVCSGSSSDQVDSTDSCLSRGVAMNWTKAVTEVTVEREQGQTYFFNIAARNQALETVLYEPISYYLADTVAPTVGAFGSSTSVGYTGFTLQWTAATDEVSAASALEYFVCSGASLAAIDTVSECESATVAMTWTAATTSLVVSGKSHSTTFYYNVLVRDETHNTAVYAGLSQATLNSFKATWKTDNAGTSANNQITLPLEASGVYAFTIDWGDGSSSEVTAWNDSDKTHTYASTGTYTVNITESIQGFTFNGGGDRLKILEIQQWGALRLGNTGSNFSGCSNLTVTATDLLVLTGVTNLSYLFSSCTSLTTVPSMNSWDMSGVTNLYATFYGAANFNQDISDWNVSSVTNFGQLFSGATVFNQDISSWDTHSATYMNGMFYYAAAFNQDIGDWDVSHVTNMGYLFMGAAAFNQDISGWDTSANTNLYYSFAYATNFNQNIGSWNTANVTTLNGLFHSASAFNQNIGGWNTGNVTSMNSTFYLATSFNQDIGSWDTADVTDMAMMFYGATSFNQNIGGWNTGSATNMYYMFDGATAFNQNLNSWDTADVTNMSYMFHNAAAFNGAIGSWNISSVTTTYYMFYGAAAFNQNIASWNPASVTTMYGMFQGAAAFNQNISGWTTASVTNMSYLFYGASSFNQPIGGWNTGNVTNMSAMFRGAAAFNQAIGSWDVSKVTDMSYLFQNASAFNQNIGGWTTTALTNLYYAFDGASAFNQDVGGWDVQDVIYFNGLFQNAALSQANYDALLIGWSGQTVQNAMNFHAGSANYSTGAAAAAAAAARLVLTATRNWTITDGGPN